jgi:hypothetical protein
MKFYIRQDDVYWYFGIGEDKSQVFSINKTFEHIFKTSCFDDNTFDYLRFKFDFDYKTIEIDILNFVCPKSFEIYFDNELFNLFFSIGSIKINFNYDFSSDDKFSCLTFTDRVFASSYSLDDLVLDCKNLVTQYCLEL